MAFCWNLTVINSATETNRMNGFAKTLKSWNLTVINSATETVRTVSCWRFFAMLKSYSNKLSYWNFVARARRVRPLGWNLTVINSATETIGSFPLYTTKQSWNLTVINSATETNADTGQCNPSRELKSYSNKLSYWNKDPSEFRCGQAAVEILQ